MTTVEGKFDKGKWSSYTYLDYITPTHTPELKINLSSSR